GRARRRRRRRPAGAGGDAEGGGGAGPPPGPPAGGPGPGGGPRGAARPAEHGIAPPRREAALPAGDGVGRGEQHGGDDGPGVALGQQQDDVGAEADLGVGVGAVVVEEGVAVVGREGDTGHGSAPGGNRIGLSTDYRRTEPP